MAQKNTDESKIMTLAHFEKVLAALGKLVDDDFEIWLSCDEEGNEFLPMLRDLQLSLNIDKTAKRIIFFPSHR